MKPMEIVHSGSRLEGVAQLYPPMCLYRTSFSFHSMDRKSERGRKHTAGRELEHWAVEEAETGTSLGKWGGLAGYLKHQDVFRWPWAGLQWLFFCSGPLPEQ